MINFLAAMLMNELNLAMIETSRADLRFAEEAADWGMGQIMAMVFVTGQITEIVIYLRKPWPRENRDVGIGGKVS